MLFRSEHQHFICRDQKLRVENNETAWTSLFEKDEEITIPLKNGEGGYIAHPEHAVEPGFGPDTPIAMRSGVDGLKFFQSVLKVLVNS